MSFATNTLYAQTWSTVATRSLPKIVKIYGAGGVRGLEAYQSGILISGEGHVLTAFSYVLDTDYIRVTLDDGRRFEGKQVGADPRMEIAVLKIEATELPHFDLSEAVEVEEGSRVLAMSNLFGVATGEESASVQRGVMMAQTRLDARRGTFASPYRGTVYVVDAVTNNPGATGGALVNLRGQLLGMLGKELRNAQNGTWLNYAIPVSELRSSVADILAGKTLPAETAETLPPEQAHNLIAHGVVLVPDVLDHTPPFVDDIWPGSLAEVAGLMRDDLVVFVGEVLVNSVSAVQQELLRQDRTEPLKLVVKRGEDLIEVVLPAISMP
jgi:serine protease Do